MTWVIGLSSINYALGLSDVRVSSTERAITGFGAQKFHAVGPFMALGIAGNLKLGFWLVQDAKRYIAARTQVVVLQDVTGKETEGQMVDDPGVVLRDWAGSIQKRQQSNEIPLMGKSHVIALHATTINIVGSPELERTDGFIMKMSTGHAKDFSVETLEFLTATGIGTGANNPEYQATLANFNVDYKRAFGDHWKMDRASPAASGFMAGTWIDEVLARHFVPTVSRQLHVCHVSRRGVAIWEHKTLDTPDHPPIAKTWAELNTLARRFRVGGDAAILG